MTRISTQAKAFLARLGRETSGLALLEFALSLPILLTLSLTGAELTNYIITKMRISQIALHLADNAARIGSGSQLQAKTITEADINDLLTGADMQSGELDLLENGRVIISSVEPVANPNTNSRYKIRWQRCKGSKTSLSSSWGTVATKTNEPGIGPTGRQTIAPDDGAAMFVEVRYIYRPLVKTPWAGEINEVASMMVRDRRDLIGGTSGVYQVAGVTPSTC
ncbi:TadE/TadG family type IV pilus assembly protein [Sphingomonas sp. M1-B02]|uniref:TadE/TadG family type IV pilus assembly protein n=1 Tax=Sphingomonas sp. M1-B02 TaxID=3114300 RepID=UPI002240DD7D|nr:pilus assembly protein [Sphingomonas sp. S6-11]UZK66832.1 pilus assembly protein [Sphingomonas sp. S6-11]